MIILRYFYIFFLSFCCFAQTIHPKSDLIDFYRTYWSPMYLGQRLDYCSCDKKLCGLPLASHYCSMMGYDKAVKATIDYNVGLTNYIGTRNKCKSWACNGFQLIRCVAKTTHQPPKDYYYRVKEFVFPRYNHYRVDWCYQNRQACGRRPAYSFCRRMGFMKAVRYQRESHVAATRALGNHKLCFGDRCNAFSSITCYR